MFFLGLSGLNSVSKCSSGAVISDLAVSALSLIRGLAFSLPYSNNDEEVFSITSNLGLYVPGGGGGCLFPLTLSTYALEIISSKGAVFGR